MLQLTFTQCEYPELQPIRRRGIKPPKPKPGEVDSGPQRQLLPRGPSTTFSGSEKDYSLFQLFRDKISRDLSGTFELPFFSLLIMRECHSSDIIRNLALSIAGLNRASRKATLQEQQDDTNYALICQSRALASLRRTLTNSAEQLRLAVIASALLYICEEFQSHVESAKQQLRSGQRLLHLWRSSHERDPMLTPPVDEEIIYPFQWCEGSHAAHATMNPFHGPYSPQDDEPIIVDPVPTFFPSFQDVAIGWGNTAHLIERFMRKTDRIKRSSPDLITFPDVIVEEAVQLTLAYGQWHDILLPPPPELVGAPIYILLSAGLVSVPPILKACVSMFECVHDDFIESYELMVTDIRTALEAEGAEPQGYTRMTAFTELAHSLFQAGTRCRDREVRRGVVKILQDHPRTQGL